MVDFDVDEILRVRTHGADRADLAAIARDIGHPEGAGDLASDLNVDFVDELVPTSLTLLDGGAMGYGDDGVYIFDSSGHRAIAQVSQGKRWGDARIVCRRGAVRIPFLSAAVDLAALSRGWAPLHGSAWVTQEGTGVLAVGWAHCGKTGALLAACERGAAAVGDDRVLLSRDGSRVVGLGRPIVVKDWHLAQLQIPALGARRVRRAMAKAAPLLDGVSVWTPLAGKVLDRLRSKVSVEISPRRLRGRAGGAAARPDVLVLLETHRDPSITATTVDPAIAARRIAAQVEADLAPTLRAHASFKYAFPDFGWRDVGRAPELAKSIVSEATRRLPTYLVRHPYPCSLKKLDEVISRVAATAASRRSP